MGILKEGENMQQEKDEEYKEINERHLRDEVTKSRVKEANEEEFK